MLSAFQSSGREATWPADRVACWASSCNIKYDYNKEDHYEVALGKVIIALRRRGMRIYNFLVNTEGKEIDLSFHEFARAHVQSNALTKNFFTGAPIFTGRADTVTFIKLALAQSGELKCVPRGFGYSLRRVTDAKVLKIIQLSDTAEAMASFRNVVGGPTSSGFFGDIVDLVEDTVRAADPENLRRHALTVVSIGLQDKYTLQRCVAWTICPAGLLPGNLFVARESLNGTLVLAARGTWGRARVLSYLTMTHQQDGTYLMKSDKRGVLDIVFRTPETPEINVMDVFSPREKERLTPADLAFLKASDGAFHNFMGGRVYDVSLKLEDYFLVWILKAVIWLAFSIIKILQRFTWIFI
jgi:hypothetical protein